MLLAGCAGLRAPGDAPPLSGRIAVTVEASGAAPRRSGSTQFELVGTAERGQLVLTSPIGTTLARASWQPGAAEVDTGQGEPERAASLDALSDRLLGERLPLAALIEWLHGRPWAGASSQPANGGFEQLGWRIDTTRRAEGFIEAMRSVPPPAITVRAKLDDPR